MMAAGFEPGTSCRDVKSLVPEYDKVIKGETNGRAVREEMWLIILLQTARSIIAKCSYEVALPNAKHFHSRNFRLSGNFIPLYSLFNLVAHIEGGTSAEGV